MAPRSDYVPREVKSFSYMAYLDLGFRNPPFGDIQYPARFLACGGHLPMISEVLASRHDYKGGQLIPLLLRSSLQQGRCSQIFSGSCGRRLTGDIAGRVVRRPSDHAGLWKTAMRGTLLYRHFVAAACSLLQGKQPPRTAATTLRSAFPCGGSPPLGPEARQSALLRTCRQAR